MTTTNTPLSPGARRQLETMRGQERAALRLLETMTAEERGYHRLLSIAILDGMRWVRTQANYSELKLLLGQDSAACRTRSAPVRTPPPNCCR
jgi:hypothetical protein